MTESFFKVGQTSAFEWLIFTNAFQLIPRAKTLPADLPLQLYPKSSPLKFEAISITYDCGQLLIAAAAAAAAACLLIESIFAEERVKIGQKRQLFVPKINVPFTLTTKGNNYITLLNRIMR